MKILVGIDGSEPSGRAVEWVAERANALEAEVVAVHAIDLPVIVSPITAGITLPEFRPIDREEVREVTNTWCAPLTKAEVPFRVVLKDGEPALTLIETAKAEDADLVVVGSRGRGGFTELLLGSTSHALSHHLRRPLLIVP